MTAGGRERRLQIEGRGRRARELMQMLRVQRLQALRRRLGSGQVKSQLAVAQADDAREMLQRHLDMMQGTDQSGAALACRLRQGGNRLLPTRRVQR